MRILPGMHEEALPSAEFYEEKAALLYQLAQEAHSNGVKDELLMLALEFQKLAERARRQGRVDADNGTVTTT